MGPTHHLDVIFDFDGVLADSAPLIVEILGPVIEHEIGSRPALEDLRGVIGPPFRQSVAMLCERLGIPPDDATITRVVAAYREEYTRRVATETPMYPGIAAMIEVVTQDHRLSICSSKPQPMVEGIIETWRMTQYFPLVEAANPEHDEPKTNLLERLVSENDMQRSHSVMVGDTRFDAIAAASVGIPMIGVAWGIGDVEDLRTHGAGVIAADPGHLAQLLSSGPGAW